MWCPALSDTTGGSMVLSNTPSDCFRNVKIVFFKYTETECSLTYEHDFFEAVNCAI